jgi:hypothetical protein
MISCGCEKVVRKLCISLLVKLYCVGIYLYPHTTTTSNYYFLLLGEYLKHTQPITQRQAQSFRGHGYSQNGVIV